MNAEQIEMFDDKMVSIDSKIERCEAAIEIFNWDLVAVNKFYSDFIVYDKGEDQLLTVRNFEMLEEEGWTDDTQKAPSLGSSSFGPAYYVIDERFMHLKSVELTNDKKQYKVCALRDLDEMRKQGWWPEDE